MSFLVLVEMIGTCPCAIHVIINFQLHLDFFEKINGRPTGFNQ